MTPRARRAYEWQEHARIIDQKKITEAKLKELARLMDIEYALVQDPVWLRNLGSAMRDFGESLQLWSKAFAAAVKNMFK
jgi:hypothetical protein